MEERIIEIEKVVDMDKLNLDSYISYTTPLLKYTSDIIIYLTLDYEIIDLSQAAEEHYHWQKDKVIDKNYVELCQIQHFTSPHFELLKNITSHRAFNEVEEILPSADQSGIFVVKWAGEYLFNAGRKPIGIMVLGKKSFRPYSRNYTDGIERYLDSIIEVVPGSFYCKDKNGVYLTCNNVVLQKGNLKEKKEIIGKTDFDVWPEEAENIRKNDMEVMEKGETCELEETIILPDGKKMYFASVKMPLRDESGKIIGIVCNSLDITELKEAKEKAEEVGQLKMDFIQNMEHDIRTPFNGIFALASILWRREEDDEKKNYLGHIVNAAKELLSYCNSILDFSRSDLGSLPIVAKSFDIFELIGKVINIEMAAAKASNIAFEHVIENVPRFIIGDEHRLTRILINLLSNAIKFTPNGYVKFTVSGHNTQDKKIIVKFVVEDTGIGIPEEKQRFIGEKFIRLSPSNKGQYKGLGLGLPLVKQFIHDLDGELDLKSEVNKGSTFTCAIPFDLPLLSNSV